MRRATDRQLESSPFRDVRSPLLAEGIVLRLIAVALVMLSGCSLIQPRDAAMASYEQARREITEGSRSDQFERGEYRDGQYTAGEPTNSGLEISDLAPENLAQTVRKLTGNGPNSDTAKQLMAEAQQMYASASAARQQNPDADLRAQFAAAGKKFEEAATRWPDSALQQDALYMQGESYFFADYYWDAELAYEALLEEYQHSRHLDAVQPRRFAIANYWLALHREDPQAFYELNISNESLPTRDAFGHAMRVFDRIRLDDPTGKLADDATLALGNAYFAARKFMKADEYYTDLRKTFPSSEHQFDAHFLGLKAKLESYQGPDYSANALLAAEKLINQIRKQFPVEAEEKKEILSVEFARVQHLKAERDWLMAQRFDRRTEYGAAKHYYSTIINEYPATPFAQQAQLRMREIGGLPDIPPQRLSWLVAAFPSDEDIKPIFAGNPTVRR